MVEKIGNVTLNLAYYTGKDSYSDGSIEDEMLDYAKKNINFTDILSNDDRWPILYHFSPQRRNLLDWAQFKKETKLLEIGAGCGALTGMFCEKVDKVIAVDLSKKRSQINAYRNQEKDNLEIVVGDFNSINFKENFDYITLIGVLEYAAIFSNTSLPYLEFLKNIKKILKKNGTLMLAIENRFGLKYWAGHTEDHTGVIFDGLQGYMSNNSIATFGKAELVDLLANSGFTDLNFYYPMPDYKLPTQIFSDYYLPTIGSLREFFPSYNQENIKLFNERLVLENIIKNKQFDFFANSFLVICKNNGDE